MMYLWGERGPILRGRGLFPEQVGNDNEEIRRDGVVWHSPLRHCIHGLGTPLRRMAVLQVASMSLIQLQKRRGETSRHEHREQGVPSNGIKQFLDVEFDHLGRSFSFLATFNQVRSIVKKF